MIRINCKTANAKLHSINVLGPLVQSMKKHTDYLLEKIADREIKHKKKISNVHVTI